MERFCVLASEDALCVFYGGEYNSKRGRRDFTEFSAVRNAIFRGGIGCDAFFLFGRFSASSVLHCGGGVMDDKRAQRMISDEDRTALRLLQHFCYTIGSANDAEDHGYGGEARRMREESCESIRNLADQHPLLTEFFPGLKEELETGRFLAFGWSSIAREADELLAGGAL